MPMLRMFVADLALAKAQPSPLDEIAPVQFDVTPPRKILDVPELWFARNTLPLTSSEMNTLPSASTTMPLRAFADEEPSSVVIVVGRATGVCAGATRADSRHTGARQASEIPRIVRSSGKT